MYFLLEEGEVLYGSCIANIPILCFSWMVYGLQIYENLWECAKNKTLKIMPSNMKIMVHTSMLQVPCWCSGICMSSYVQERKNLVGWQGTRDKVKDEGPAD